MNTYIDEVRNALSTNQKTTVKINPKAITADEILASHHLDK